MKFGFAKTRVYYRPAGPGPGALLLLAICGLGILMGLGQLRSRTKEPLVAIALRASERTALAFEALRTERLGRGIPLDPRLDPAGSGLVFSADTSISTSKGSLASKQTSVSPDFAALLVQFFDELKLKAGDHVAIGYTGSFPALNTALLAAATELKLDLVIVASAASSDYGASDPRFTWLDMEKVLRDRQLVPFRTQAASLGGIEDRALGLSPDARQLLLGKIQESGSLLLQASNYDEALRERIAFFLAQEGANPYRAYVNIGGGAISLGRSRTKTRLGPGVVEPKSSEASDSVAAYFLSRDVPVIHLGQVVDLARHYGLPVQPKRVPSPGSSRLFRSGPPSAIWTALGLSAFVALLVGMGARARKRAPFGPLPPEIMVESPPSRHARPPSAGPFIPEAAGPAEEDTLHSLRPDPER